MTTLFLTRKTFVCSYDGVLVFLDLPNDKYSSLDRIFTVPISILLGLPAADDTDSAVPLETLSIDEDAVQKTVDDLIMAGLVTKAASEGKQAEFIPQESDLTEMLGYVPGDGPSIKFSDVLNFFRAFIVAKWRRKFEHIEKTVSRVKHRKERASRRQGDKVDFEKINEIVEVYKLLRPLFVTVKNECLFNSLFLIEFLSAYRVYPSWYFSVKLNEFSAHCWVQGGKCIYDDSIHATSGREPIMIV